MVGRERGDVVVNKLTPVLFVKEIEPVLPLWVDGLGFARCPRETTSAS